MCVCTHVYEHTHACTGEPTDMRENLSSYQELWKVWDDVQTRTMDLWVEGACCCSHVGSHGTMSHCPLKAWPTSTMLLFFGNCCLLS